MMFNVKIDSASDLITNSSDQSFIIISDTPELQLREMLNTYLMRNKGLTLEDIDSDSSMRGSIWRDPNYLHLDFPVMCNWETGELLDLLREWFGTENVRKDTI